MALTPEKARKIEDALKAHANHPIIMEMNVGDLIQLIGPLQLAMRHPTFPPRHKAYLRDVIKQWRNQLWELDANLAFLVDAGFNVTYDVPRR